MDNNSGKLNNTTENFYVDEFGYYNNTKNEEAAFDDMDFDLDFSSSDEKKERKYKRKTQKSKSDSMELYDNAYRLLNPDPTLLADSNALIAEFEIDFILGNVDEEDYDAFVEEWMNLYGQTLLDDATETFREYGLLA